MLGIDKNCLTQEFWTFLSEKIIFLLMFLYIICKLRELIKMVFCKFKVVISGKYKNLNKITKI